MAITFPTTGLTPGVTTYTYEGRTWIWTGTVWQSLGTAQGLQGTQGLNGEFAAQGIQGPIGVQGPYGVQGPTGSGIQGIQGTFGIQGIEGPVGNLLVEFNPQNLTVYDLVLSDNNKFIELNNASPITVRVPTNSVAFPIGTSVTLVQVGSGRVTVSALIPATTTINATPGFITRTQWSSVTLVKRDTEKWYAFGDLAAV